MGWLMVKPSISIRNNQSNSQGASGKGVAFVWGGIDKCLGWSTTSLTDATHLRQRISYARFTEQARSKPR